MLLTCRTSLASTVPCRNPCPSPPSPFSRSTPSPPARAPRTRHPLRPRRGPWSARRAALGRSGAQSPSTHKRRPTSGSPTSSSRRTRASTGPPTSRRSGSWSGERASPSSTPSSRRSRCSTGSSRRVSIPTGHLDHGRGAVAGPQPVHRRALERSHPPDSQVGRGRGRRRVGFLRSGALHRLDEGRHGGLTGGRSGASAGAPVLWPETLESPRGDGALG